MRRTVEPPPSTQCDRCKGQLKLKRVDANLVAPGQKSSIFACANCGTERTHIAHHDLYASRSMSERRFMRA